MRETRVQSLDWEHSPGEGNGNPLQYSCLENPMDRGAWWATVHGVAKSRTRLSDFTSLLVYKQLKKLICKKKKKGRKKLHFSDFSCLINENNTIDLLHEIMVKIK